MIQRRARARVVAVNVEDQSEIVAFLADPTTYPGVASVQHNETHISEVFLAGDRAYKLKRAVRFPYLDFSTSERRRAACEAEVALNRRTAPKLYIGTNRVTRGADGRLALDGPGATVDWLVVMQRFDESTLFDRMAERGGLSAALMAELAEAIARFHAAAEARPDMGGRAGLSSAIDGIVAACAECAPKLDPAKVERFRERTAQELVRLGDLLDRRRQSDRVRHCHGDLHLRNIFLDDGRPTLFDAIEFSEALACVDVLYDLAFLLMDLLHRGRADLANAVLNRYLEITLDHGGLAALPLFLSCRAAVRAHVTATMARGAAEEAEEEQAADLSGEARNYLDLALALLAPPPPSLVAVGGLSGTGKSTLARALAPEIGAAPGALVLRSDVTRKELAGVDPTTTLGQDFYTPAMSQRVYRTMLERARTALAAGHAVILDAVYARPDERAAAEALADTAETRFIGLWLEAPGAVLEARVAARGADASDATADVVRRQLDYRLGTVTWNRLDATGNLEETVAAARQILRRRSTADTGH